MKKKKERRPIDIHQSKMPDPVKVSTWLKEHAAYVFDRLIGRKK